jgi:hypothetical protein
VHWGYATIEALRQHRPEWEFDVPGALAGLGKVEELGFPPARE